MKLVSFSDKQGTRIGVLDHTDSRVFDLATCLPKSINTMLEAIENANLIVKALRGDNPSETPSIALADIKLEAPFTVLRRNILCVGKNYHEHAHEFQNSGFDASAGGEAVPTRPIIFTKSETTVIGPHTAIDTSLDPTHSVDYEGELCVVIGRSGRGICKEQAYDHVFGYTIINDVTSRTLQHEHKQWFIGKNLDTFCPMGPTLVTADEIPDVRALRLQTRVNGELRQDAKVSQLIFDIPTLIETLSKTSTLLPGDIIATGTCAGVGIGFTPPRFLKPGDIVAITIEPIGTLENPVI